MRKGGAVEEPGSRRASSLVSDDLGGTLAAAVGAEIARGVARCVEKAATGGASLHAIGAQIGFATPG